LIEAQVAEGFRPRVIERWLRVYGDSLRRIAETEGDWWHTEVEVPLLESGMTPAEMMQAGDSRVVQRIAPFLDQAIIGLYHGHQEHTWTKNRKPPKGTRTFAPRHPVTSSRISV
jgi:hypothetical protein